MELTRDEIRLEADLEEAYGALQRPQDGDRDMEVMNQATARQDAEKDRSGPGWTFVMEKGKRVPNRGARS